MIEHAVIVAGAGPTGLMLAGELKLARIDVAIVERRANQDVDGTRARGLHSRTIEVLDQRGLAERFLDAGKMAQIARFASVPLDIGDFPTRHPYGLALRQQQVERILADWVAELGVPIYRGQEIARFAQDDAGVDVEVAGGQRYRAQYLVACDGGRSRLRKEAGIAFVGTDPTTSNLIAEVELAEEPPWGIRRDAIGIHGLSRLDDRGRAEVLVTERHVGCTEEPTLHDLSEALTAVYGTDYGAHGPRFISRFTDMTRQAAAYRDGRLLIAGDAAHVHPPDGGHGLQVGIQDAVNLGWKLAQVVNGTSPHTLLDTYHDERHPVAARLLRSTLASVALRRSDDRTEALRGTIAELLGMDEPRKRLGAMISGLDVRYGLGLPDAAERHPLLGRRMPDLDLTAPSGPLRVFTLLHDARPLLLNLGEPRSVDIAAWSDRVRLVDATYAGEWVLPVLGPVDAPNAVLVRPDGYVAWAGEGSQHGLADALTTWFGPPIESLAGDVRRASV
jgi:2-polyprenyl-6-methoxyphenol hydroxylase-like FAD-dependent oxidoreductase